MPTPLPQDRLQVSFSSQTRFSVAGRRLVMSPPEFVLMKLNTLELLSSSHADVVKFYETTLRIQSRSLNVKCIYHP